MARTSRERPATYVYCAVQNARPVELPPGAGLPGLGRPRLLGAGPRRWLVVADAPRVRFGAAAIERRLQDLDWVARCAVAHASLVEACLPARAVVPVKLFTLFDSDDRAVAQLARPSRTLDAVMRRVAGRAEWGVRIRLDARAKPQPPRAVRTGAQYLAAKRRALTARRRRVADDRAQADRAFRRLAACAAGAVRRPLVPGSGDARGAAPVVLDAAFLVNGRRAARFRAAASRLAEELRRRGYRLELSGPWPPYHFVEA
jgi:Gas vesicle synthesis protein GvpL/GvpF